MPQPGNVALTASLLLALVGTTHAAPTPTIGIPDLVELDSLSDATGFRIDGSDAEDYAGTSVAPIGDVNADGFPDIIITAPRANDQSGECYVIFGTSVGIPSADLPGKLNGANGFYIYGENANDRLGNSAAGAGDVNGDKIPDIIVGAPGVTTPGGAISGAAYVIFGRDTIRDANFPTSILVTGLDGTNGFRIDGEALADEAGICVATAGDFNADKISDMLIGAPYADKLTGRAYIVFGRKKNVPFPATLSLSDLDGTNGLTLQGARVESETGTSVAPAWDVNGDKIHDVIIGTYRADVAEIEQAGEAYVVFGRKATNANPLPGVINLGDLNGDNGFTIRGAEEYNYTGAAVAGISDVNADKIADILIGAPGANTDGELDAGSAYVVFGRKKNVPFPAAISVTELEGTNGFSLATSIEDNVLGNAVAAGGDINRDGIADFLVAAPHANSNNGIVYAVFGRNAARDGNFPAALDLTQLDGTDGFAIQPPADSIDVGTSIAATDFNRDGISDILIGAPENTIGVNDFTGQTYVLFGPKPEINVVFDIPDTLTLGTDEIENGGIVALGPQDPAKPSTFAFLIENQGLATLNVSRIKLPRGVTLGLAFDPAIEALNSNTLFLTVTALRPGAFNGKVTLTTNDVDEKKFSFILNWTVPTESVTSTAITPLINLDTLPDLNSDWITDAADLALMLRAIEANDPIGDLNNDDHATADDLVILLSAFNTRH